MGELTSLGQEQKKAQNPHTKIHTRHLKRPYIGWIPQNASYQIITDLTTAPYGNLPTCQTSWRGPIDSLWFPDRPHMKTGIKKPNNKETKKPNNNNKRKPFWSNLYIPRWIFISFGYTHDQSSTQTWMAGLDTRVQEGAVNLTQEGVYIQ